jgi:hypothetical protein
MWRKQWCTCLGLFLIFLLSFITGGYAQEGKKVTTGAFVQVNRLDTDLQKGVSTKMDVRQMLGAPNGMGGAIFTIDPKQREIWYYENVEVEMKDIKREEGVFKVNVRQQVLLVFFEKGVYDGYMWFTNTGKAEAR